ncbi:O-succinylbenzoate-CoA ligase [Cupriavidus taiwanensis]|uniref:class I adenylate-forming enzyme family protein n=1 Tax=Cupriavidus taiwanensis TaxID=164546 RepID=UPI000E137A64|nr:long-chain-fatty-acid--CoA ligase [Cupriavidus taiwanensis]SOZ98923.1 O-succinylbenzoate-CoA ligase [Cupriavidus taiwanensis]
MPLHLSQLLAQRAALSPSREAIVCPRGRWTYAQFHDRCTRLARSFAELGVSEGDRVAICAKNGEALANAVFAAARAGATAVVLNWRLSAAELTYILADAEPAILLYEDEFAPVVEQLVEAQPLRGIVRVGERGPGVDYDSIVDGSAPPAADFPEVRADMPAVIMYTSGTTGRPKGAMLSHEALIWAAHGNAHTLDWRQDSRFLLVAPMFHIGGLSPLVTNVLKGCTTVLRPDFDPAQVWQTIAAERISSMMSVPLMLQAMLAVAKATAIDASSLSWVSCGASAVPKALIEAYLDLGISVNQVYGTTEFCGAVSFWTAEMGLATAHSQGKPLLHGEVRIVNPATGTVLPPEEDGEIWCRGPMAFSGYWQNPDATRAALHQGWYRTGDIGRLDRDGFLFVVDRLEDMIISGGENIYPAELEAAIRTVPAVADVAVVGRADAKWGEIPVAFVVCKPGMSVVDAEILAACRQRLAGYKCVKAVEFIDSLPRNAIGKILKQALRELP